MSRPKRWFLLISAVALAGAFGLAQMDPARAELVAADRAQAMPPFTHAAAGDWLNSAPLTWPQLRGKVVLLDVWTFDCWNCYRSIPWLRALEQKFSADEFIIVGVHTPELPREYNKRNVLEKVAEYEISHPVMIDNDYSYWKALDNRYWPAFYLVDAHGRARGSFVGETHAGDDNARAMEEAIARLIREARSEASR